MFANPALDHRHDGLHCPGDVDFAFRIADGLYLLGQLGTKPMAGQAYDPQAVNRTVEVSGKPREQGVGPGTPAKEDHIDTASVVLIDKHPNVNAAFKCLCKFHRSIETGRDERSHCGCPRLVQPLVDRLIIRPSVEDGSVKLARCRASGGKLPISEMCTKHNRRLWLLQNF